MTGDVPHLDTVPREWPWRTVDSMRAEAPKGGEHFLVYKLGGERIGELAIRAAQIGLARYVPNDRDGWLLETDYQFSGRPTHWMLLPAPPVLDDHT